MLSIRCKAISGIFGTMTLLMIGLSLAAAKDKIKWEELIARHLESIGTAKLEPW